MFLNGNHNKGKLVMFLIFGSVLFPISFIYNVYNIYKSHHQSSSEDYSNIEIYKKKNQDELYLPEKCFKYVKNRNSRIKCKDLREYESAIKCIALYKNITDRLHTRTVEASLIGYNDDEIRINRHRNKIKTMMALKRRAINFGDSQISYILSKPPYGSDIFANFIWEYKIPLQVSLTEPADFDPLKTQISRGSSSLPANFHIIKNISEFFSYIYGFTSISHSKPFEGMDVYQAILEKLGYKKHFFAQVHYSNWTNVGSDLDVITLLKIVQTIHNKFIEIKKLDPSLNNAISVISSGSDKGILIILAHNAYAKKLKGQSLDANADIHQNIKNIISSSKHGKRAAKFIHKNINDKIAQNNIKLLYSFYDFLENANRDLLLGKYSNAKQNIN